MSAGHYAVGLVFFAGTVGSSGVTAVLLRRRYLADLQGVVGVLAWAPLFFAGLIAAHLLPGMLGVLTRGSVLLTAVALTAIAAWVTWPAARGSGRAVSTARLAGSDPAFSPRLYVIPVVIAVAVAAWALVLLWERKSTLAAPPFSFDMLTFDLPLIGRWIQSQSIWVAHDLVPLSAHAAYPQNGDVVCLAAILPWRNAFLAPVLSYPMWGLGALAVGAIAVEMGAQRWAAILVASLYAATPLIVLTTAVDDVPDVFMWAMFGIGVLFLLRHLRRPSTAELVVGGLGLGLAFGSKWYGLTCVPIVAAVWLVAALRAGRGRRPVLRDVALLAGVILVSGGFWLLRNLLEYGDPAFPHQISVGGISLFSAPRDLYGETFGFSIAHYLGDWQVWNDFLLPQYRDAFRLPGALVVAGLAIVVVVGAWRARRAKRWPVAMYVTSAAILVGLVYLVTPQTAVGPEGMPALAGINARYAVPGLLLGAAVIGWGISLADRRLWLPAQLVAAVAVADAFRGPTSVSGARVAAAFAVLLAAGYVGFRVTRSRSAESTDTAGRYISRPTLVAGTALVVLAAAGAAYALERRYDSHALRGRDPVVDWVLTHARSHTRIGMTGSWSTDVPPVLEMFGPTFGNTVRYVGRVDRGFVQHHTTYDGWIRAVRNARLDLLLVGRQPQPLEPDREAAWAAGARLPVVATSPHFVLYRLPGGRSG